MWKIFSEQSSCFYLDILPEILKKYNNDYHSSIKMTSIQASKKENEERVYFSLYGDIKHINKKAKFKIGDTVRISKYKTKFFDLGYTPNWTEEIFIVTILLNIIPKTYMLKDLQDEKISETFYEPKLLKTNQNKFRIEKVIRKNKN